MEEDIFKGSSSKRPSTQTRQQLATEAKLKAAIDAAEEKIAYESAHDKELLRALRVVSTFIRRKKRVCYGGTAMNAILPASKRFYDPNIDLPDYDFYTPTLEEDTKELVEALKEAGFEEVYQRVGMHEGTKKILVNFVAVADISEINDELFNVLYSRSIARDGIHYTDPDVLRMMMYLELSRPRGEVGRWEKVFERLQLINTEFPIKAERKFVPAVIGGPPIPFELRYQILRHVIREERVLLNGPVLALYQRGIRRGDAKFQMRPGGAIFFTSPTPRDDAEKLKRQFRRKDVRLFLHRSRGEIVPERVEVRIGAQVVALIMQEAACHSYNRIPVEGGGEIYVGSPEFLITVYLALTIFTHHSKDILGSNAMEVVKGLIYWASENYKAKSSQFPPFSIDCQGHQVSYVSLLRAKVLRIREEKEKRKAAVRGLTRSRRSKSRSGKTRRK
jgi:hypothetical protein